jgi:hypothetical protein
MGLWVGKTNTLASWDEIEKMFPEAFPEPVPTVHYDCEYCKLNDTVMEDDGIIYCGVCDARLG